LKPRAIITKPADAGCGLLLPPAARISGLAPYQPDDSSSGERQRTSRESAQASEN